MKLKNPFRKKRKSVSIVTLNGMIATGRGLNDAGLAPALEKAFSKKPDAGLKRSALQPAIGGKMQIGSTPF